METEQTITLFTLQCLNSSITAAGCDEIGRFEQEHLIYYGVLLTFFHVSESFKIRSCFIFFNVYIR